MNISIANYGKIVNPAMKVATRVLNKIISDNKKREFPQDIIVDVGCGNGKVTKEVLADSVPHKKLLALDIDPSMIDHARQKYSFSSIDYIIQDFGQSFKRMDLKLQNLENQVDLIFSNYALHWILGSGKLNSVINIAEMLKPGGRFYGSICIVNDAEEFLRDKEKIQLTKGVLSVPTRLEQISMWDDYFKSQNLKVEYEVVDCIYDFETPEAYQQIWTPMFNLWDQFIVNKKRQDENADRLTELFLRSYGDYRQILSPEKLRSAHTVHVDTMFMKCTKLHY